jgi:hypothetical protein
VARLLLKKGADVNAKDKYIRGTVLLWAAEKGHEAVALPLERGVDVGAKDKRGWTALHWAELVVALDDVEVEDVGVEEVEIVEAAEEDAGCGASSAVVVSSDAVSLLSLLSAGVGGGGGGGGVGGGVGVGVGVGLSRGTIRGAGKVEGVSGRDARRV